MTPTFSLGAQLQSTLTERANRDLDREIEDNRTDLINRFDLALRFLPRPGLDFFGEVRLADRLRWEEGEEFSRRDTVTIERAFLLWRDLLFSSVDLQMGRQRFVDPREWLYDENLDAIRLIYQKRPFELEGSISSRLFEITESEERSRNGIVRATYQIGADHRFSLYGVTRREPDRPRSQAWVGFASKGEVSTGHRYWLEGALVRGDGRDSRPLRGHGYDAGGVLRWEGRFRPSLALGYAFGSGDADPEDRDRRFQQTGLQENQGFLGGVTKLKYYGELFNPELSNIQIWTAGVAVRPFRRGSVELIYHRYLQTEKDDHLRSAGIRAKPSGEDRNLGEEVDLVVGVGAIRRALIESTAGIFIPGKAFPGAEGAFLGRVELRIDF